MKHSPQFVRLFFVLGLATSLAYAGDNWNQKSNGTLASARNVRVKVDMGSVVVRGSQRQDISYVVHSQTYSSGRDTRRQDGAFKINSYVRGDTAWIEAVWEGGHPHRFSGEFVIEVPRDTAVTRVETGGGCVEVTGVAGRVEIESGGGKIRLDDIGGAVDAETGGDSIDIGTVGGDLKLETGGGNISIKSVKGQIHAQTGGGNVVVFPAGKGWWSRLAAETWRSSVAWGGSKRRRAEAASTWVTSAVRRTLKPAEGAFVLLPQKDEWARIRGPGASNSMAFLRRG